MRFKSKIFLKILILAVLVCLLCLLPMLRTGMRNPAANEDKAGADAPSRPAVTAPSSPGNIPVEVEREQAEESVEADKKTEESEPAKDPPADKPAGGESGEEAATDPVPDPQYQKVEGNYQVAITFDDGPTKVTGLLLDELLARGIKATFFPVGYNIKKFPEIVQRMFDEGHSVGTHTYSHRDLNTLAADELTAELENSMLTFAEYSFPAPALLRPPYGNVNEQLRLMCDLPLINWSVDPKDWASSATRKKIANNIVGAAHDGAIILCHDKGKTQVYGAIDAIDRLVAKGYSFVTVDELLFLESEPVLGTVYRKR